MAGTIVFIREAFKVFSGGVSAQSPALKSAIKRPAGAAEAGTDSGVGAGLFSVGVDVLKLGAKLFDARINTRRSLLFLVADSDIRRM